MATRIEKIEKRLEKGKGNFGTVDMSLVKTAVKAGFKADVTHLYGEPEIIKVISRY